MSNQTPHFRLRPGIRFRSDSTSTGFHFVAEDVVNNKYWRIGSIEYEMCALLDGNRNLLDSIAFGRKHSRLLSSHPHSRIHQALVWLVQSGLVESILPTALNNTASNNETEKSKTTSLPKANAKLFDPSSFRVPLVDGLKLDAVSAGWTGLFTIPLGVIVVLLWLVAIALVFSRYQEILTLTTGLFVAGKQWWLLLAWVVLKFVHEAGHAIACVRIGARTGGAGIGFLFFTPTPFVMVSNTWSVPNKWSRILVSAAGMIFELTLAAIAIVVLVNVESLAVQQFCAAIITLGTFSTLVFNGNPLMKFDGYYILIDLIGRPNLWQDGRSSVKAFFAKLLYDAKTQQPQPASILLYGLASLAWRTLTLTTIGWGLWVAWDGIGLMVVIGFACLWFVLPYVLNRQPSEPTVKFMTLLKNWKLYLPNLRRLAVLVTPIVLIGLLPSPFQIYWPGHIDYIEPLELRSSAAGVVVEVLKHDGDWVQEGDEILRMKNPTLQLEYEAAALEAELNKQRILTLRAQKRESELQAEEAALIANEFHKQSLSKQIAGLNMASTRSGKLLLRGSRNLTGTYLEEGTAVGFVVKPDQLEVNAILPQDSWEMVANHFNQETHIHLSTGEVWTGELIQVLPRSTTTLNTPSLGGNFGGPIAVEIGTNEEGEQELRTLKPRLQTRISLVERRRLWGLFNDTDPQLPPPGLHCSVRLAGEQESIWATVGRWIVAAFSIRFKAESQSST